MTTTAANLSKAEWVTILNLSTRWEFYDIRKLAKRRLDPLILDPVELIQVGRAASVPKWVFKGYKELVFRDEMISEGECARIGERVANKLYMVRHVRTREVDDRKATDAIMRMFAEELKALEERAKGVREGHAQQQRGRRASDCNAKKNEADRGNDNRRADRKTNTADKYYQEWDRARRLAEDLQKGGTNELYQLFRRTEPRAERFGRLDMATFESQNATWRR